KRLIGNARLRPTPTGAADPGGPLAARLAQRRDVEAVHAVCYEPRWPAAYARALLRTCRGLGVPAELHLGSTWNHHSYQAVHGRTAIQVVAVTPRARRDPLIRLQRQIAAATC